MSEGCLEVVQELELILASPRFQRTENLAVLFRWLVEQAVASRRHLLNEHDVARLVYGIQDHDPTTNSRVRRQMSRLRERLREYYGREGLWREWCFEFRDGFFPELKSRDETSYVTLPIASAMTRIRMLPFRAGGADLTRHLLPLELELQNALLGLENVRLLGDSYAGGPHLMLSAAVARFGTETVVFVQAQDPTGVILKSVRTELREVQYAECIGRILPLLGALQLAHTTFRSFA